MNSITNILQRFGLARLAAMGLVTILMLAFFAFLIFRVTSPQMALLYSGLSLDDSSAIVSELQSTGTPYQLRGEGETILVPRDQITTIRMNLAQNGLPSNGQVGYEIFDNQSTLGATSFIQDVNLVRALEGELARTISSLARVRSARVHLVLPKRELFRRERQDPSASITLGVRGTLSSSEVSAIQHLVSAAVQGMTPNMVSIIDNSGRLLAAGDGKGDAGTLSNIQDRVSSVETRLRTSLEELLSNVVGPGRAKVQVTAELQLNRRTNTTETFNPDGQVVRSTQTSEVSDISNGQSNGGAVSVGNELPGAGQNAGGDASSNKSSTTQETVNYEISKSTRTEISEAGALKRLSVAVLVDGVYTPDGNGATTYQPRSDAEIAQITSLVRSAIGFDAARGDQLQVINMRFAERPGIAALGTAAPGLFDFTRDDLITGAQMLVTLVISLALLLFVLRPLIKRVLEPEAPLSLPAMAELGPAQPMNAEQALEAASSSDDSSQWMDQAKSLGEAQTRTLEGVGNLVTEHPKQASVIVRDWLSEAA